eukprot:jgi/Psemu1/228/gm1.228_g
MMVRGLVVQRTGEAKQRSQFLRYDAGHGGIPSYSVRGEFLEFQGSRQVGQKIIYTVSGPWTALPLATYYGVVFVDVQRVLVHPGPIFS